VHIHTSIHETEIILKWGVRLLYLQIFLSVLVVSGQWWNITTYTFLGSVLCLTLSALFFLKDEDAKTIKE